MRFVHEEPRNGKLPLHCYAQALLLAVLIIAIAGCNSNSRRFDTAPAGGAPPMGTAVGPIPGTVPGRPMPLNPYSGDKIAIREGRRLFLWYNCAGCHGGHAGGGMGPSLRDPVWLYGDADAQIFDSIASGRGKGMPEWGTRVPQEQIWKLVAYIKSLRTPEEADPPIVPTIERIPSPVITPAPSAPTNTVPNPVSKPGGQKAAQ